MRATTPIRKANVKQLLGNGTDITKAVVSPTAGVRTASGVGAVTGTLVVASGLTTITAVTATLNASPALTGNIVTAAFSGANITLAVWKPTASGDCTPIASTTAVNVSWVAWGT
jgi:hypothetical protein